MGRNNPSLFSALAKRHECLLLRSVSLLLLALRAKLEKDNFAFLDLLFLPLLDRTRHTCTDTAVTQKVYGWCLASFTRLLTGALGMLLQCHSTSDLLTRPA
mmetsp:Transcript_53339/g.95733  ORF Transcript_53339/g.95733 Transcript_53339/m.95733 type:complete len:101 (+) Transcript_53339:89-391(+)